MVAQMTEEEEQEMKRYVDKKFTERHALDLVKQVNK